MTGRRTYPTLVPSDVYEGIVAQAKAIVKRWEADWLWRWWMKLMYGFTEEDIDFYRYVAEGHDD